MPPAASKYFEFALQQHEIALQPRILDSEYRIDLGRDGTGEVLVAVSFDARLRDVDVHHLADATADPLTRFVARTEGQRAVARGRPDATSTYEFRDWWIRQRDTSMYVALARLPSWYGPQGDAIWRRAPRHPGSIRRSRDLSDNSSRESD